MNWRKLHYLLLIITLVIVTACYRHSHPNLVDKKSPASECRLIKHELGETCVPLNPQRIIVVDQIALEALVALDLKPIGTANHVFFDSKANLLKEKIAGISYIGKTGEINLEKVLQLNPDLIVSVYGIQPENYPLLSKIAPTVQVKHFQSDWQTPLREIGKVVNKIEKVEELLTQYEQRFQTIREQLENKFGKLEVTVSRIHGGMKVPEFSSQFSFPGGIVHSVGISMPPHQRQLIKSPDDYLIILSLERLDLLDSDALFIAVDPGAIEAFQEYQKTPLWQTLNVVKNKKVYQVDSGYWVHGSILSANAILDDLVKYLLTSNKV
ncbi:ABC transporter substrate-binding protein [Nostoc parmelioides]|uniref:Iron-siderophore ABC transporter substrate-binding protein n=1 Tax=Nostoc parmelioides FACHB-3921 TaxID=2692909 RepID=A0ABR8BI98_9NOSO|nr:iron-siderophore ABC transporter substrate-binding protein [Nostoc parmelioides FACHB-3921]